jgi:hypothetical protein
VVGAGGTEDAADDGADDGAGAGGPTVTGTTLE